MGVDEYCDVAEWLMVRENPNFLFQSAMWDAGVPKNALPSHSDVKGSGHLPPLRRVFSLSVKLLLSMRDASIMEVVLTVMESDKYGEVA